MGTTTTVDRAQEWAQFQATQRSALAALVAGDPRPYQELWARTAEVSLLGAFGGVALGWEQVRDRLAAVSDAYDDGLYQRLDQLVEQVDGDLAYTMHLESIRSGTPGGGSEIRQRRVTKIYRHDDAGWHIVHMHSDPLLDTAFPDGGGDRGVDG